MVISGVFFDCEQDTDANNVRYSTVVYGDSDLKLPVHSI